MVNFCFWSSIFFEQNIFLLLERKFSSQHFEQRRIFWNRKCWCLIKGNIKRTTVINSKIVLRRNWILFCISIFIMWVENNKCVRWNWILSIVRENKWYFVCVKLAARHNILFAGKCGVKENWSLYVIGLKWLG